jgi:hypothetical protein
MQTRAKKPLNPGTLAGLLLAALLSGCPLLADTAYTVRVEQSAGGTISVSPAGGPAGTTIRLSNDPDDAYAFDHYTVDGAAISGDTFALDKDVTVSGVFHAVETYDVRVDQSAGGTISASPTGGPAGITPVE